MCRHCVTGKVNRPRGLCWSCYYRPGVRDLYPSSREYVNRGTVDFYGEPDPPDEPTRELPGTYGKIAVMAARAEDNRGIFHPLDARW